MTSDPLVQHTAAAQLAGYLYQIQKALLRLFELEEGETLAIEVLDDISVTQGVIPVELTQVKYHATPAGLGDKAPDLWKTLAIWASAFMAGTLDLGSIDRLLLLTTDLPLPGTIPEMLAIGTEADDVVERMRELSRTNATLSEDVKSVLRLSDDQLSLLADKVELIGRSESLEESRDHLKKRIRRCGFHDRQLDDASVQVCGWLWLVVVERIGTKNGMMISEAEFHTAISKIRDAFTGDALPARFPALDVSPTEWTTHLPMRYVRQLDVIRASDSDKWRSIKNYVRATTERSEWLVRGEVLPHELSQFDSSLVDRWRPRWERMCDGIGPSDDDQTLSHRGLSHFHEVELLEVPIRPNWFHVYLTTGSYHGLADRALVGWHPRFKELV